MNVQCKIKLTQLIYRIETTGKEREEKLKRNLAIGELEEELETLSGAAQSTLYLSESPSRSLSSSTRRGTGNGSGNGTGEDVDVLNAEEEWSLLLLSLDDTDSETSGFANLVTPTTSWSLKWRSFFCLVNLGPREFFLLLLQLLLLLLLLRFLKWIFRLFFK